MLTQIVENITWVVDVCRLAERLACEQVHHCSVDNPLPEGMIVTVLRTVLDADIPVHVVGNEVAETTCCSGSVAERTAGQIHVA